MKYTDFMDIIYSRKLTSKLHSFLFVLFVNVTKTLCAIIQFVFLSFYNH